MLEAAEALDFERAASIRDRISTLRDAIGEPLQKVEAATSKKHARHRKGKRGKGKRGGRVPRPKKQR